VANPGALTLAEDSSLSITLTGSDPDNDPLTYNIVTNPSHGVLTGTAPNLTYTPTPLYYGPDNFTFKVNDGFVDSDPATVNLTIKPINHAPVADSQNLNVRENSSLAITLTGSDPDNDPLTSQIVTYPANGTLVPSGPNVVYTPRSNYSGMDSFTFKVNDGQADSAPAVVKLTVRVNHPPVANPQTLTLKQDTILPILLTGSDPDNDPLTYIVTNPGHGSLSGIAPNLIYTPNLNYHGTDKFTFKVNDGHVNSTAAAVSLTIKNINDSLVANPQSLTLNENTSIPITLTGYDANNNPLTFQVVTVPLYGILTGIAPNLFYTPNAFFYGLDSLTFLVNNGLATASATVKFTINRNPNNPPKAVNDIGITTPMETPVTIDVLNNDSDPDVGDTLSVTYVSQPANGTANINSNDTITYTPNPGFAAPDPDSFFYMITDHHGGIAWAWVEVTVLCVDPQIISFTANNANETTITYGQSVTLSWTSKYSSGGLITGTGGTRKVVSPNGTMTVTPGQLDENKYKLKIINCSYCGGVTEASVLVNVLPNPVTMRTETHLGFDKSKVQSFEDMQTWWKSSPYYVTSLYLPGAPNHQVDTKLSGKQGPKWVQDVLLQGWGLIPIWVGRQDPSTTCETCSTFGGPNGTNTILAKKQGKMDADSGVTAMQKLGLDKTIIYNDLEQYNNIPSDVARAYLSGWVEELHNKQFLAGVYGNLDPALKDFSSSGVTGVTPQLDAVWITLASTPNNPDITIWDLTITPPSPSPPRILPDTLWPNHQRMHQFLIEQLNVTFGGVTFRDPNNSNPNTNKLTIDDDIIDAPVVVGQGIQRVKDFIKNYDPQKTYQFESFEWPQFPQNPLPNAWMDYYIGINDMSGVTNVFINANRQTPQIVGSWSYQDRIPEHHYNYDFLYTIDNQVWPYLGLNCSLTGLNNFGGWASGFWRIESGSGAFVYANNGAYVFNMPNMDYTNATGINDAGQVVGTCWDQMPTPQPPQYYPRCHGFLINVTNVIPGITRDYPGAYYTEFLGINGFGQVVGCYQFDDLIYPELRSYAFIYNYNNDQFSKFDNFPGAVSTSFLGINNNGQIVGSYVDINAQTHGFLYDINKGLPPIEINFPGTGVIWTIPCGINDFGQIVGVYAVDNGGGPNNLKRYYFLATPQL
jgi:probable HAF family extracellular repeat protein